MSIARHNGKSQLALEHVMNNLGFERVTHQQWESRVVMGAEVWECSGCKTMGSPQWKRCPVCEAKMDGEKNE